VTELPVDPLWNTVKNYDWGSRTAIATLTGRPVPTSLPEAEMWLGAHPSGSSSLVRQGTRRSLAETVAADPLTELGRPTAERFGSRLPYLLKLIAVDLPLSLQVHPSQEQAEEGFARGAYVDPFSKPELICALTPFTALAGFRAARQAADLLEELGVPELQPVIALLAEEETTAALRALVEWPAGSRRDLVTSIVRGATAAGRPDHALVVRLAGLHPEDPACLAPLLLERYELEPGEAIFLGAGVLHCYLSGFGVEIMSGSDNVLRAGLTSKPIEVEELLRVTVPSALPLRVEPVKNVYRTPAPEFSLGSVSPGPGFLLEGGVPRILLCTRGEVEAGGRTLRQGESAFVSAAAGPIDLRGSGTLFWAEPGQQ
jgi:mannose-6-phosphate isomerase